MIRLSDLEAADALDGSDFLAGVQAGKGGRRFLLADLSAYFGAGGGGGAAVSDAPYDISWNGVIDVAPSKNAVYDKFAAFDGAKADKATTLAGYGITDAINSSSAGAFGLALLGSANLAAAKTSLSYTKADVGLGSVDNTSDATKNVLSATKLATPRTINGVSFDGTANITVNAVDATARVPATRTISTTAPLAGGGALSGDLTLSISAASGAAAGSMSAADFSKLAAIAAGATANSSDSFLLSRSNHTGTQAISTTTFAATSRFAGRLSAGAGAAEELTGTQATTLLDNFTSTLKGLAPASGGGTTNFLRADGTWAAPAGAGGGSVSDAAYGSGWNGVTTDAPSKNAVYDKIELLDAAKANLAGGNTFASSQQFDGAVLLAGTSYLAAYASNGTGLGGTLSSSASGTLNLWTPTNGNAITITDSAISLLRNTTVSGTIGATNLSGTNTGDQTTISGNAGSATVLQTPRTINGVSFNGSANITINAVDSTARLASSAVSAFMLTLLDDTDAATARATIGAQAAGAYLTANQNITLSGDVSGSGTTGIAVTLATVNANTGTYGGAATVPQISVNGKGLITGVSSVAIAAPWSGLTGKPTTLAGYGITDTFYRTIPFFFTTKPTASEVLCIFVACESMTLADDFAGSTSSVGTNPASSFVMTVKKNGAAVGTITISTGGVTSFATTGTTVVLASGDRLTVEGPATPDTTIANVGINLKGAL